jgi:alkyl sulfatase BDS1-like metallo-beta-lactamase superfamily hydrolase
MLGSAGSFRKDRLLRVSQSLEDIINAGLGSQDAVGLSAGIHMSRGIANAYLVTTGEGDVLINTGLPSEAPEIRSRFGRVSANPLRIIVFTQGHPDHVGGWSQLTEPGVETVAQANHAGVREYWRRLHPFYAGRIARLWGLLRPDELAAALPPEADVTTTFIDSHAFTLGGRRFELYAVPGGEATDALVVWMPGERTVIVGNLFGPVFGHVPNLYTIRGDKIRSAQAFLHSVDRVIALEPEVLITGHDRFEGAEEIARTLRRVHDATAYLLDRTIEGMNSGLSVWELMETITLPDHLVLPQLHGKVSWIVRAVFEEHTGWFRYESTTELYAVPPSAVWDDLVELAGGSDRLIERAREHVDAGRPLEALHLIDTARAGSDPTALNVKRGALRLLLDRSDNENFSEVRWLEQEMAAIDTAIGQSGE